MEAPQNKDYQAPPISDDPKIPPSQVLSFEAFIGGSVDIPNLLDEENCLYLTSGRMAIALALEMASVQAGDEVLVPAYHCSSMIAPIVNAGATPIFYRITPSMMVDIEDVQEKLTPKSRALLVTHYFGFPQPLPQLRAFCDSHELLLLEDCAHSFFGEVDGQPLGSYGDYAIGSLMKFFPVFDGGCLTSKRHNLDGQSLTSGGKGFELQSFLNVLERSFQFKRLIALKWVLLLPISIKNHLWSWLKKDRQNRGKTTPNAPVASSGGFDFDPNWIHINSTFTSKKLVKTLSLGHIAKKRRNNFTYLANALGSSELFRPLIKNLNENVVPYVFPLIVDCPDPGFYKLRSAGVPLMRWEFQWDGVNMKTCEVSHRYSRQLIQVPCHQSLSQEEMSWMVEKIKDTFSAHSIV